MSIAKSIAKNAFFLYLGDLFSKLLTFAVIILMARYFGPEEFGKYSFVTAFTAFLYFAIDFGTNRVFVREIACHKNKFNDYFNKCLTLKLVISVVALPVFVLIAWVSGKPYDIIMLVLFFGFAVVFNSVMEFFKAVYRSFERMGFEGIIKVTDRLMWVVAILVVIFFGLNLLSFAAIFVLISIINMFTGLFFLRRYFIQKKFRFKFAFSIDLVKKAAPFALSAIFYIIYYKIDMVMLSFMKGDVATGIYNASYQFIEALIAIPLIFQSALYPVMSRTFKKAVSTYNAILKKAIKLLMLIAFPIVVGTVILATRIGVLFFGENYAGAGQVLRILIVAILFIFISHVSTPFLMAGKKEKLVAKSIFILVILNILLNLFLIPLYGAQGAAVATLATELVFAFIMLVLIYRTCGFFALDWYMFKVAAASILMGFVVYLLIGSNIILLILIGALVYSLLIFLFGVLSDEDKGLVKDVLGGMLFDRKR